MDAKKSAKGTLVTIRFLWVLPLFLVAAYFLYSGFKYTRMIANIFLGLVYDPEPEPLQPSVGEKRAILDSSDREIEALWVEKKGSAEIVIFCHESGASKESWEKYAHFLPGMGFHLLSVDLELTPAGPGKNALSQWPVSGHVEKLLTVIRWARKAIRPDIRVVLFGVSNGADVAFAASFLDPTVKAVVADGLFSMKEIFRDYIRKWAPILVRPNLFGDNHPRVLVNGFTHLGFWYAQVKSGKRFVDVETLLKKPHVPLLLIHGADDDYIPPSHQAFLQKAGQRGNTSCWVVPLAKHNQAVLVQPKGYEEKVGEFLRSLGSVPCEK
ncbi:MAG: alpha/beta hydrolase [Candidatus Omnitrophica bacterium]|nr:alpha/beta hydrolase [Candidatus Omnitrophota bacterium]